MKKLLLLLLIATLSFACKESNSTTTIIVSKKKIDPALEKLFIEQFPRYTENPIILKRAEDALTKLVDSLFSKNFLDDIPVEILSIHEKAINGKVIVQFNSRVDYNKVVNFSDRVGFDIIGYISEDKAALLNDNEDKYRVFGKYKKRLSQKEMFQIVRFGYYGPDTEIKEEDSYSKSYKYNIGTFLVEIDSIQKINL